VSNARPESETGGAKGIVGLAATWAGRASERLAATWADQGAIPRRWGRGSRLAFALKLAICMGLIALSVLIVGLFERYGGPVSIIWIANGMLLAYLLLTPRLQWPAYLVFGFAGLILGSVLIHEPWHENLLFNGLDLIEVIPGALLLRNYSKRSPDFTKGAYLLRFLAFSVIGGPFISGSIYALVQALWQHGAPFSVLSGWILADGVGMGVSCPIFVAIFRAPHGAIESLRKHWPYLVLLVIVTLGVFEQVSAPLLFLIYPVLILILLRLGLGWAAASCLFVTFAGGWFTVQGRGPLSIAANLSMADRCIVLQVFVVTGVFMLYSVSVVLESRRAIERRLENNANLHKIVTENSRDAIMVADLHGSRSYVSSAVERLIGWPPKEFAAIKSLDLVHPDDLPQVKHIVQRLGRGGDGGLVECRVKKYSGDYLWIEASLHLIRDAKTGAPTGILNVVRDVTDRKLAEKKLQDAYDALEALASTDALTGIANRRKFDFDLHSEWFRSLREQSPISVLMLDVDWFKAFNDTYGHTRGDGCLKQVAEAAQDVVTRPGDLVSRFGGEEFAIILPDTDNWGAMQLAGAICASLQSRNLAHLGSPFGVVTVSVGCATRVPAFGRSRTDLVELADRALYAAKRAGRNRSCNGNELELEPDDARQQEFAAAPPRSKSA
jgi:diguanylate cyclase (GGDEF)-like protein/PAS domain S-box-containing protein